MIPERAQKRIWYRKPACPNALLVSPGRVRTRIWAHDAQLAGDACTGVAAIPTRTTPVHTASYRTVKETGTGVTSYGVSVSSPSAAETVPPWLSPAPAAFSRTLIVTE